MRISRRVVVAAGAILLLGAGPSAAMFLFAQRFPPDTTPEGAYLRIGLAVTGDRVHEAFAYLETGAQWGLITTHDHERRAYALVEKSYPPEERPRLLAQYKMAHEASDAAAYFSAIARSRGWVSRLRRDLSGISRVEIAGERATVETARGTRYPFRRRENGIWGLTMFTAELRADAERSVRDFSVVERAAADYGTK